MFNFLSTAQFGHAGAHLSGDQNRPKTQLQEYCSGRSMHPQLRLYELHGTKAANQGIAVELRQSPTLRAIALAEACIRSFASTSYLTPAVNRQPGLRRENS